MSAKVLVTGANGHLGYDLTKLFGKAPMVTLQHSKEYTEGDGWTDNSRLEGPGWRARPIEESIKDTVEWLQTNPM